jgi:hypothetical protein
MLKVIKENWPLWAAVIILWATLAALLLISINQNEGHFIYAQDDAYIHLAIAKNFAEYGVWGVTRHEFSSSASSLLWILVLSFLDLIIGDRQLTPLILNILFATLTLYAAYFIFRRERLPQTYTFIILLAIIFLTPLANVVFTGMEHVLQILITLIFVYTAAQALSIESPRRTEPYFLLALGLSPLVTMIRYEGLFLIAIIACLFLCRRRWLSALLIVFAAFLPLMLYGLISLSQGWFWLPNSVLLKGHEPAQWTNLVSLMHFFGRRLASITDAEHVLLPVIIAITIYLFRSRQGRDFWEPGQLMIIVFAGAAFAHLFFASIGSFFRYEAYLVVLGIFIIALTGFDLLKDPLRLEGLRIFRTPKYAVLAGFITITTLFLAHRGLFALENFPSGPRNIYEQQFQMSRFLHEYYQGKTVIVNDIGMVNYFNDLHCLDIWGLANLDIAKLKKSHNFNRNSLTDFLQTKKIEVAIIYDCWFKDVIPATWRLVGQWTIKDRLVCTDETVSFYAPDPEAASRLIAHLRQFAPKAPKSILQTGPYTESETSQP